MELKQETVKQIRGLIIFTAVLIVCLWKFDVVISAFQFVTFANESRARKSLL